MHRIKRYEDRGSPCLSPTSGLKNFVGSPLTRIEYEEVDRHS